MSKKKNLKAEIRRLKSELMEVCTNPNSCKASAIIYEYKLAKQMEDALWGGQCQSTTVAYPACTLSQYYDSIDTRSAKTNQPI